jgi:serine phosphatase RsbU (regulator of sigma subunit)/pSer/pThr/pTyr-binding forkhead associated (FHA) protein
MPTLQLLTGSRAGTYWPIKRDRLVIGRESTCDVELRDPREDQLKQQSPVSKRHALITYEDGRWYIEDGNGQGKKSHNGTYVNSKKLAFPGRHLLRDKDRIRICDHQFVFLMDTGSLFSAEASVNTRDSTCLETQPAERLRLLIDVSMVLRGALETNAILDRTLEHLFKMFPQAQRGLAVFPEEGSDSFAVRSARTSRGEAADPRFSSSVVRRCLDTMEALLGNDLLTEFPDSDSISEVPSRFLMCAPLLTHAGQALGALQLDTASGNRRFTLDDLRLFLGVANQASIALSNARLHQEKLELQMRARDLEVAQQVQLALLPSKFPVLPGYDFFAYYQSAQEVGGDIYDFIPLPDGRLAVLLGDVTGKGVPAALVVARFSVEARVCLETIADPAAALDRLNVLMMRSPVPEKFITLIVAVLDPRTHTLTLVNAGHPSPLLIRGTGEATEVAADDVSGWPIGLAEGMPYVAKDVRLEPGDRLLMYSDGVSEAPRGNKLFGLQGVIAAVGMSGQGARTTVERLIQAVKNHTIKHEHTDDITVVCFGRSTR